VRLDPATCAELLTGEGRRSALLDHPGVEVAGDRGLAAEVLGILG